MTSVFAGKKDKIYYAELPPYRAAFERGVPVLCYHKIGSKPWKARIRGLWVSRHHFVRQIHELKSAGFSTTSLDNWREYSNPNPKRCVLTFDDGSVTVLKNAAPILAEAGFQAIVFLVSGQIGGRNEWDIAHGEVPDTLMDDSQVRDWLALGHAIGSHTVTHPRLPQLNREAAREEITASKKALEDRFGLPIRHFCYPYGHVKQWVRDLVEEAGYETAVTLNPEVNTMPFDPFLIHRIGARWHSFNFRRLFRMLTGG